MRYQPGQTLLDKYRIEAHIGRGAFAEVYHVTHLELNAPRAIKVLHRDEPGLGSTQYQDYQQRFRLEAQLGAKINHPNVVRIYDFEKDGDTLLLVMEYAAGGSLSKRLKTMEATKQHMSVLSALRVSEEIAAGLSALHKKDIVHRDIKPSNILFDTDGVAKVADLGLVQIPGGPSMRSQISETASHPGTPGYMSPEQETTSAYLKPSSDVYALGATLFQLLTGRLYASQKTGQTASVLREDVPTQVDELLAKLLAKDADMRPWGGAEALTLIQAAQNSKKEILTKSGVGVSMPVKEKNIPGGYALAIVGVLVLIAGGLWFAFGDFSRSEEYPTPELYTSVMLGEFNLAVAEFMIDQGNLDAETGLAVSQQIYQRIDKSLQEITQAVDMLYEVRGPDQIGPIAGATAEKRADSAAKLAQQINADLVIYGTISDDGTSQTITPELYISERLFSLIPEFLGRHPLGEAIRIPGGAGSLVSRVEANRDIAGRGQAIAYIATGASLFSLMEYEDAFSFFAIALQADGWEGDMGKESLYLMLGNAAGKLERVDDAEFYFNLALVANPQYARANIGLGETYFVRALGIPPVNTFAEISQSDLNLAEEQYLAAQSAIDQPLTADIPVKVDFGLGRLSLVRYQILGTQSLLTDASTHFQAVVDAAEIGNTRIAEFVAQSHGHLGSVAVLSADLDTAQHEYQIAAEISQSPRAKAAFWAQLGSIYQQLGDTNLAIDAYQQAVAITLDEDARQKYQQALAEIENR